jgi:hypothetical protein
VLLLKSERRLTGLQIEAMDGTTLILPGTRKAFGILTAVSSREARLSEHLQALWSFVSEPTGRMKGYNYLCTCLNCSLQLSFLTDLATEILDSSDARDEYLRVRSDIVGCCSSGNV